jgi:sugar-specific transcriptional regulator TrmB
VNNILDYLGNGKPFKSKHETITAKDLLKKESIKLRRLLTELLKEINEIKSSETFKIISTIVDPDEYFTQIKSKLLTELDSLNNEYENV